MVTTSAADEEILYILKDHCGIWGRSGSGKTTLAATLYNACPNRAIFFNTQDEHVKGNRVRKWKLELLNRRRVNFIPHFEIPAASLQLDMIIQDLFEVGRRKYPRERPDEPFTTIFVDEAHEYVPLLDPNASVLRIGKRGKRYGVGLALITQNPVSVNKDLRTQLKYHVIFELNDYNRQYFRDHGIPFDKIQNKLVDPHDFVIYDGKKVSKSLILNKPLKRK